MIDIKNKTAIVTGASRGIGAAIANKLASLGANIAIVDIGNAEVVENVCKDLASEYQVTAKFYSCNVADFAGVKETVAKIRADFGTVDILVNNAGINRDKVTGLMTEKDFDDVIAVDLKGAFNMIRHCTALLMRSHGTIVNISSISGLMGNAGQVNYSAAKAGLVGMTKSVARELAPKQVTCNAVAPGFIETDMTKNLSGNEALLKQIPLGHMGKPEDVAEAVAFLAQNRFITGEVLRVDGGLAM